MIVRVSILFFAGVIGNAVTYASGAEASNLAGGWRCWLDSKGGELPFEMVLTKDGETWSAKIVNGSERIAVPRVAISGHEFLLDIDHYDSQIKATISESGERMNGEWRKTGRGGTESRMGFHALHGYHPRFPGAIQGPTPDVEDRPYIEGRWDVVFSSSEESAIGLFGFDDRGSMVGTFMTPTGDYRFLAGSYFGDGSIKLSCFDGGHAFLFHAKLNADGTIAGDFWSRDTWHETWTGRKNPKAKLPDAFGLTRGTSVPLDQVAFKDVWGENRKLDDPEFAGKVRIIEVFGTWCPNCHDAATYLASLDRRWRTRGVSILGVAFELTDDFDRSVKQVNKFAQRHEATYPILIGGYADREKSDKLFPLIDKIRSYPTFIFMDENGKIAGVYTGFSGPATGEAYYRLREQHESLIEGMLGGRGKGRSGRDGM
ncbi:MAG: TlpA disulfide reductase family protein [Planctomycetota bacterium]|jgi:thiol-disulfide isomerase/thioredoxin